MREIKFEYIYRNESYELSRECITWHKKVYTLKQLEKSNISELSDVHDDCDLVARRQYTGLKDNKGKEIYEGDVVYAHMNDVRYLVKHGLYDNTEIDDSPSPNCYGWYITRDLKPRYNEYFDGESLSSSEKYLTVVGNIYENPELLEGGQ